MKTMTAFVVAAAILATAAMAASQTPADQPLDQLVARASKALARVEYRRSNKLGEQALYGQAVCIDAKRGTFMTGDISTGVPSDELDNFVLFPAGGTGKKVDAELLGSDPEEGLTFLAAKQPHDWSELKFSSSAGLNIGQRVISVGLLEPRLGSPVYMGLAVISAKLRLPGEFVAVTGGTLSNESSPVMTTDGRVIGLVRGQLPTSMQLYAANRWNDTMIRELQHTRGFVPTDEFAHVIANIPTPQQPRKLPWIGVVTYEPLTAVDTAATESLRGRPGVVVGRVIGESPATKADIRQRDVIVALDGKPLEALPTPELVVSNFSRLLSRFSPGAKVKVTILRDGKDQDREVLLTERPPTPSEAKRYYSARLGLAARDMVKWDEYMAPAMFIKRGVPITGVVPGGPVHQKLFVNDVITSVNKRRVTNVAELSAVLDPAAEGTAEITLTVLRRGMEQPVVVTPSGVPVPRGLPGD